MTSRLTISLLAAIALAAAPARATHVLMDYGGEQCAIGCDFYNSPFPGEHRRNPDGTINMHGFPGGEPDYLGLHFQVGIVDNALDLVRAQPPFERGFGTTSAIYFKVDGELDPSSLPVTTGSHSAPHGDVHPTVATVGPDSTVYLIGADVTSPDYLQVYPVIVGYEHSHSSGSGTNDQLTLVPLQGVPLRPNTLYAAVVTVQVRDAHGIRLERPASFLGMLSGIKPPEMSDTAWASYRAGIAAVRDTGFLGLAVALTVYRTADPTEGLRRTLHDALVTHPSVPAVHDPFTLDGLYPEFCVFRSTLGDIPQYQVGAPSADDLNGAAPYGLPTGDSLQDLADLIANNHHRDKGSWVFDAAGQPVRQSVLPSGNAWIYVTIPRKPMPTGGFPVVVFERAGGGGDRPLADRQATSDFPFYADRHAGHGPAEELALAGFAGVQVDNPLGGGRRRTSYVEDDAIFNIYNLGAMRDNIRQTALELALIAHALPNIVVDASACPTVSDPGGDGTHGSPTTRFDTSHLTLMGHSVGATVAPLTLAVEPMYRQAILSGAGGSYVNNVLYKQQPRVKIPAGGSNFALREAMEAGILLHEAINDESNPKLNLLQWVGEAADPPPYNRITAASLVGDGHPVNVLMFQGLIDHYIEPPVANASSLSLGLDLAQDYTNPAAERLADYDDSAGPHDPAFSGGACTAASPPSATCGYQAFGDRRAFDPFPGEIAFSRWPAGGALVPLPAQGSSLLVQHFRATADAGINSSTQEDGHEVMFQEVAPKHQYRCFLKSSLLGTAGVPLANGAVVIGDDQVSCCQHAPNVAGVPLLAGCDCAVQRICADPPHAYCCTGSWDAGCVAYYQANVASFNAACSYFCHYGTCSYTP